MSSPLADRLRPTTLTEYVGQNHLIGDGKIITSLLESYEKTGSFPSLVFWGPPGVGKTSLARIIAKSLNRDFLEFSAVDTSAKKLSEVGQKHDSPVIFLDEIHRFNKSQQDRLLPLVESGKMILIGATTENPSFEIIRPLLSRLRVLVLNQLSETELQTLIDKSLKVVGRKLEKKAHEFLILASNGDGRSLINIIEIASNISKGEKITVSDLESAMQRKSIGFDRQGEEHYNTISAFIKSMRASQPNAAVYYLSRMIEAGQDPLYIARRMVVFASEDIGMAQPTALVVANEVFRSCEILGYPECAIPLAHGAIYLSEAKKDRSAYDALQMALSDVRTHGNLEIPKKIRNAPTKLMKDLEYGKGYQIYDKESYLPEKIKNKKYFK